MPGEFDGLPRNFSAPHPEAVGSRGDEAVEWIETRMRAAAKGSRAPVRLRWFQWVSLQRLLEVRADGTWCWPLAFWSVARQQGKTVSLGELACWLCDVADRAGDPIELIHAANTVVVARQHQAKWVPWAKGLDYGYFKSLGDSQILWPEGSVWRAVARDNMWGRTLDAALLDEVWRWTADEFWAGVHPTLVERWNSLAVCFSAANDDDRGLAETLQSEPAVLRLEWGALESDDRADPATWRTASAFWTPQRERAMRIASTKPGFDTNWLNIWPRRTLGRWVHPQVTAAAGRGRVPRVPPEGAVCAVECSLDGKRWAVAAAWRARRHVVARVWEADTIEACTAIAGHRSTWAHRAVVERYERTARATLSEVSVHQHRAATGILRDALMAGQLRIAGVDDAAWDHVRATPADGGEIIDARRSTGDVQTVKALAWAVWAVMSGAEPEFVL
jgi:hypothetical protein